MRRKKNLKTMFNVSKENFSEGFVIAVGFAHNGKLKINRVEKNVKITSTYYYKHILFQSSNMTYYIFTPGGINLFKFVKISQVATHHNPLLISWKE